MKLRCVFASLLLGCAAYAADSATTIWFNEPATKFQESLPLGSGRSGAMVFGGVDEERIILNENSLSTASSS